MEPILVADVGTATTMAWLVNGDPAEPPPLPDPHSRENYWLTAAAPEGDGFVAGGAADQPGTDLGVPRGRFLRDRDTDPRLAAVVTFGGREATRLDLLTELLRKLRGQAARKAGRDVDRVLLTVPDWPREHDAAYRDSLLTAARRAGFLHVEFLSAACAVTLAARVPQGRRVLVCDAGASALRLVLVEAGRPGLDPGTVVAVRAVPGLGGDAMDARMAADVQGKLPKGRRDPVTGRWDWDGFLRAVTAARQRLTDESRADVSVGALDKMTVGYTRRDLIKLLKGPLGQVRDEARAVAGKRPALTAVLLAGGCAGTPQLAETLEDALKTPAQRMPEPGFAVVAGGAEFGDLAPSRAIEALPHWPGTRDLAWGFKESRARLVRWLVAPGDGFAAGARLAVVRSMDDDRVAYLTADFAGTLREQCAVEGTPVDSGDVLAIADTSLSHPRDLPFAPYHIAGLPGEHVAACARTGAELLLRARDGRYRLLNLETGASHWVTWQSLGAAAADLVRGDVTATGYGSWLAAVVTDGAVTVHGQDGRPPRRLAVCKRPGRAWARLSADGTLACVLADDQLRVMTTSGQKKSRDLLSRPAKDLCPDVSSAAFSGDGGTLVVTRQGRSQLMRKSEPGAVAVVDVDSGRETALRALPGGPPGQPPPRVAVSADGTLVMVATGTELEMWHVPSLAPLWTAIVPGPVRAAAFFAGGSHFLVTVCAEGQRETAAVWDCGAPARRTIAQGAARRARPLHPAVDLGQPATQVRVSPDGRFLLAVNDHGSAIWGLLP